MAVTAMVSNYLNYVWLTSIRFKVRRCGQSHAVLSQSCGFDAEIWERLGEIIMEVINFKFILKKLNCFCYRKFVLRTLSKRPESPDVRGEQ